MMPIILPVSFCLLTAGGLPVNFLRKEVEEWQKESPRREGRERRHDPHLMGETSF